jgi:hypothetical protein
LTCPNVVVVHDLVEEWATFVDNGVEVPEQDGEGEKIDAAVAANILIISSSSHFFTPSPSGPS